MSTAERTLVKPAPGKPRRTVPEVDIRICLGTGGVAAGSREVLKAFEEKLAQTDVLAVIRPREDDCAGRCASVTGTGCQGLCAMDPLVEIHMGTNGSRMQGHLRPGHAGHGRRDHRASTSSAASPSRSGSSAPTRAPPSTTRSSTARRS